MNQPEIPPSAFKKSMPGIYLFSLHGINRSIVRSFWDSIHPSYRGIRCQLFGVLGPCDLVLIDLEGNNGPILCQKLGVDLGKEGVSPNGGTVVYYVPFKNKTRLHLKADWLTLCFLGDLPPGQNRPDVTRSSQIDVFKLSGFYSYLCTSKQPFWKCSKEVLNWRAEGRNTFTLFVMQFDKRIDTPQREIRKSIQMKVMTQPGLEMMAVEYLTAKINEAKCQGSIVKFSAIHGIYDLNLDEPVEVYLETFLSGLWAAPADPNSLQSILSTYTYFPGAIGIPTTQPLGSFDTLSSPSQNALSRDSRALGSAARFPFLIPHLVAGIDCSDRYKQMTQYVSENNDQLKSDFKLRLFLYPGGESPTIIFNKNQVHVFFYVLHDHNDTIWQHEMDLALLSMAANRSVVMIQADNCQKEKVFYDYRNVKKGQQVRYLPISKALLKPFLSNFAEAAATCVMILKFAKEITYITGEPDPMNSRNLVKAVKKAAAFICGENHQHRIEISPRLTIAVTLIFALLQRAKPGIKWFSLINSAEELVEKALVLNHARKGPLLARTRKYLFLGSFSTLVFDHCPYSYLHDMADFFTDFWGLLLDHLGEFCANLLGTTGTIPGPLKEADYSLFKMFLFDDGEINSVLQGIASFYANNDGLENPQLSEKLAQLFVETKKLDEYSFNKGVTRNDPSTNPLHDLFNLQLGIAHLLYELKYHATTSEEEKKWLNGIWNRLPVLKASDFRESGGETVNNVGFECLSVLDNQVRFGPYLMGYVAKTAFERGMEQPKSYKTYQLLRRIQVELDCLNGIIKGLKDLFPSLKAGEISRFYGHLISFNVVPWLLFGSDGSVKWPTHRKHETIWDKGNPWSMEYCPLWKAKVCEILQLILSQGATPFIEITEGDTWDKYKVIIKVIQSLCKENSIKLNQIGIGIDDQYGAGTDVERLVELVHRAQSAGFKKIMIKADGKALDKFRKSKFRKTAEPTKNPLAFHSIITAFSSCFDSVKNLTIVLEGYDGYDTERKAENQQVFIDDLRAAADAQGILEQHPPLKAIHGKWGRVLFQGE